MDTPTAGKKGKPVLGGGGGGSSLSKADLGSGRGNLGVQVDIFKKTLLLYECMYVCMCTCREFSG